MTLGPDEQVYLGQAGALRAGKLAALRDLADEYLEEPSLAAYPSPLRWLWVTLLGLTLPIGETAPQIVAATMMGPAAWLLSHSWVAAVWAATSPLVLTLCRRRLQDVPVALGTVLAIGCSVYRQPIGLAVAVACCLCLKESTLLALPALCAAWIVSGGHAVPLALALTAGGSAWALTLLAIFGRRLPAMIRAAAGAHGTAYGKQHQAGAPHRLLVDLVLTSPMAVLAAILGAVREPSLAAALVALLVVHAAAPIRNVRFVLAADILLRIIGASAMTHPFIELPAVLAVDAYVAWSIRHIYDPVTHTLAIALGMPAAQSVNK